MRQALCLLLVVPLVLALPVKKAPVCGYESCPAVKQGMLNVHLVPHTHDDVGWLKTVDQYYYGSQNGIQKAGVQYILDSVVNELLADPDRRFIYVETAFLMKWWEEQDLERQQEVQELIDSGRLEIVGGAWSMNDEAAAHYHSIIDEFAWGLRKLNDSFGRCSRPRVGWQIDPFGHSKETASIFKQMGYDGLFLGRLDYQDKQHRLDSKTMEMMWDSSVNLDDTKIFTHSLYNNYAPPPGFCFDVLCSDEPIIDDKRSPDYNVDARVEEFLDYVKKQAEYYKSDNIILTMGEDFYYQDATMWYKNLDKLIAYVNARQESNSQVNAFYSTPGCYLKAVHDANLTWSEKQDDFFPYASDAHSYWTGYFTSRPTSKYFERQGNNLLQVCKQLHSLARLQDTDGVSIDPLREAMGIMQHHDAITGTEKQKVADDYARILSEGFAACSQVVQKAVNKLASSSSALQFSPCLLRNVSQCDVSQTEESFVVTLYNPLSRIVTHNVRLPVAGEHYSVRDPKGVEQVVQVVPVALPVLQLPERSSQTSSELVFQAKDLPPLGFRAYYVTRLASQGPKQSPTVLTEASSIKNEHLELLLDPNTKLVKGIVKDGDETPFVMSYAYYEGFNGNNNIPENRSSGAYIFRPIGPEPTKITELADSKTYSGDVVTELHQTFNDWLSHVVRVYKGEKHVEFEWLVGPIPIGDGIGKEVVSLYRYEMNSSQEFLTDSNGREMVLRKRDFRPSWDLEVTEPQSENYYPVTSRIVIRDAKAGQEMAILPDRAQGGSSLNDGQIELMIHRRLLHDDRFGVGEALNETAFNLGLIARGQHWQLAGGISGTQLTLAAEEKLLAQQKLLDVWTLLTPAGDKSFQEWADGYTMEYSGLKQALPDNVQILTLEPWKDDSLLLRLEHILEKNDDENLSKPVTVSLQTLFAHLSVASARETTLDGNQWMDETTLLRWQGSNPSTHQTLDEALDVLLQPMQIRTFVLQLAPTA